MKNKTVNEIRLRHCLRQKMIHGLKKRVNVHVRKWRPEKGMGGGIVMPNCDEEIIEFFMDVVNERSQNIYILRYWSMIINQAKRRSNVFVNKFTFPIVCYTYILLWNYRFHKNIQNYIRASHKATSVYCNVITIKKWRIFFCFNFQLINYVSWKLG